MPNTRSNMGDAYYRECLQEEFLRRNRKNARYSLRSFAQFLQMSDGALSQILSGKRVPSKRTAERLVERLGLASDARRKFWLSLARTHDGRDLKRRATFVREALSQKAPAEIAPEDFAGIAGWQHIAVLELAAVEGFRATPAFVAARLGLSAGEATLALDRLRRLGLLVEREGRWEKSAARLATVQRDRSTASLRKHQSEMLGKALEAIEQEPIGRRVNTGMTMAVDAGQLEKARALIDEFSDRLSELMESGPRREVYQLSVALFPLTKPSRPAKQGASA